VGERGSNDEKARELQGDGTGGDWYSLDPEKEGLEREACVTGSQDPDSEDLPVQRYT